MAISRLAIYSGRNAYHEVMTFLFFTLVFAFKPAPRAVDTYTVELRSFIISLPHFSISMYFFRTIFAHAHAFDFVSGSGREGKAAGIYV